ncbi:MAG: hypothetical protein KDC18_02805 [Alphaproteobacteria bacterium]|nr:hypothetical protein [Alphaproteobacteria bacterium]MCB9930758.1 hypothetical protein [Alphaproteobacteria bacterium]
MSNAIRADLLAAHDRAWDRLARPGTWWSGAERVAIAAATRAAIACPFCQRRKAALSANMVSGAHAESPGGLPTAVVDLIHRIRTDADRFGPSLFARFVPGVLSAERYVELVGLVASTTAIDTFDAILGRPLRPLPDPKPGQPSRHRPKGAAFDRAYVPMVAPEAVDTGNGDEAAMYAQRSAAYIHRALSLVPAEVVNFFDLDDQMYLPDRQLRDFGTEYRAISHAQIELLAARMSALNRCTY